jgi:hypothetical protein
VSINPEEMMGNRYIIPRLFSQGGKLGLTGISATFVKPPNGNLLIGPV